MKNLRLCYVLVFLFITFIICSQVAAPAMTVPARICSGRAAFNITVSPQGGLFISDSDIVAQGGLITPSAIPQGTYSITYSVAAGPNAGSVTAILEVLTTPTATILFPSANPHNVPFCNGPVMVSGSGAGSFSGAGINGSMFDPSGAGLGSHILIYTVMNTTLCVDTAATRINVVVCPGIEEHKRTNVRLFPNPATSWIQLELPYADSRIRNYRIVDAFGRIVEEGVSSGPVVSCSVSELPPGVFFIKIDTDNQQILRFVKVD